MRWATQHRGYSSLAGGKPVTDKVALLLEDEALIAMDVEQTLEF